MIGSKPGIRLPAALLSLALIGGGLLGCGGRAVDSTATLSRPSPSAEIAGVGHDEIRWHAGDIDSAFAAARAARKPVLLYWGADWCPPCSRLKSTVFRQPEFVERTRLFVAFSLDGDEPGAQRLGEEFGVHGYPTVIVLSPDREEITRIALTLERHHYTRALDLALAASRPASAAYAAVLGGLATDSDLRLLAYYSWRQDDERLVPEPQLPAALKSLEAAYPSHLVVEQSRLFMAYLDAVANTDPDQVEPAVLTGEDLAWARTRLREILTDSATVEANYFDLVYRAHVFFAMVAQPADAGAERLADAWDAVLADLRDDPETSAIDRIGTLYGTLCLFTTREPGLPPPARLVWAVRRAVREADRGTDDPYARMSLFSAAYGALSVAGLEQEAYDFMTREVERSLSPEFIMLSLAGQTQWHRSETLSWAERAWRETQGPATRFQRGARYVGMLARLTPDAETRIEDTVITLFREASATQDAFFLGTTSAMRRMETYLHDWNAGGLRAPSVARIRAEVLTICDGMSDAGPSSATCRTFLEEQAPEPPT